MSKLLLSLQNSEQLQPAVRDELEQLIATIQAWANVSGDIKVPKDLTVAGTATIEGLPRFATFGSSNTTIANNTETPILWTAPTDPDNNNYWSSFQGGGIIYDAQSGTILLPETGVYLLHARIRWTANATGTRLLQFRIAGDDGEYQAADAGSGSVATSLHLTAVIRVTQSLLDRIGGQLPIVVEAYQTSGGNLDLSSIRYVNVVKLH